jgi:transposase
MLPFFLGKIWDLWQGLRRQSLAILNLTPSSFDRNRQIYCHSNIEYLNCDQEKYSMRKPASIVPWLGPAEMRSWVRSAPDKSAYQRRLAIWLTQDGQFSARRVATHLAVSTQAVWKWIGEYNKSGPRGLDRKGRGGRRRSLISIEEEQRFLAANLLVRKRGSLSTEEQLRERLSEMQRRDISLKYVRRLLSRHSWRDLDRAKGAFVKANDSESKNR